MAAERERARAPKRPPKGRAKKERRSGALTPGVGGAPPAHPGGKERQGPGGAKGSVGGRGGAPQKFLTGWGRGGRTPPGETRGDGARGRKRENTRPQRARGGGEQPPGKKSGPGGERRRVPDSRGGVFGGEPREKPGGKKGKKGKRGDSPGRIQPGE